MGAAASGSDLVILEQALSLGLKPHIVLPFAPDRFRQTSVESRGPAWVGRYEAVLAQVHEGRAVLEVLGEPEDDGVYTRTNGHLLARIPVGSGPHGLCVYPQPGRYSLGHTGIFR